MTDPLRARNRLGVVFFPPSTGPSPPPIPSVRSACSTPVTSWRKKACSTSPASPSTARSSPPMPRWSACTSACPPPAPWSRIRTGPRRAEPSRPPVWSWRRRKTRPLPWCVPGPPRHARDPRQPRFLQHQQRSRDGGIHPRPLSASHGAAPAHRHRGYGRAPRRRQPGHLLERPAHPVHLPAPGRPHPLSGHGLPAGMRRAGRAGPHHQHPPAARDPRTRATSTPSSTPCCPCWRTSSPIWSSTPPGRTTTSRIRWPT